MTKTELSIITVTYNSQRFLTKYFSTLLKNIPKYTEIIIVDNGSTDDSINVIKKYQINNKNIRLIENKENKGFGKGCNQGVKEAQGEYIMFLNPDTEVIQDAIDVLLQTIKEDTKIGIVSPLLIQPDGLLQPILRKLPTVKGAIKEYYLHIKRSYEAYTPKETGLQSVECVVGAVVMMSKEIFLAIGGFDERYFLYYEDLELCRQIKKRDLKIIIQPEATLVHAVGGSISEKKMEWLKQSAGIYHGKTNAQILHLLLLLRPSRFLRKIFS